jgi:hypothetical protein
MDKEGWSFFETEISSIKLSSVITDIFGKSGRYLILGLLQGKTIDELIAGIPSKRVQRKEEKFKNAIKSGLSTSPCHRTELPADRSDY